MQTVYGSGPRTLTLIPSPVPLAGRVILPGSKSITNRALLVAALARGTSRLSGALKSVDTALMAGALAQMGVSVEAPDQTHFVVTGTGGLAAPSGPLVLGNAGTATRFLTAAATIADGKVIIDGDSHMRQRPIAPLVTGLAALGVDIESKSGCPPVTINGTGQINGGTVDIDGGLSSQYVSALLMVAPMCRGTVGISLTGKQIGARGYIDLTLAVMRAFGASVEQTSATSWRIEPTGYINTDFAIEPDASAATYLWAAQALTGGAIDLGLDATAFTQPDALAHRIITAFPAMPAVIDGSQMQDAIPTLAVLAAFNRRPVRFAGIANLRVKECDRIAALANGLDAIAPGLGREDGDDLIVDPAALGGGGARAASIDTRNDHRIAMSFALAGLKLDSITIQNPDCVAKTFPDYWKTLAGLGVAFA